MMVIRGSSFDSVEVNIDCELHIGSNHARLQSIFYACVGIIGLDPKADSLLSPKFFFLLHAQLAAKIGSTVVVDWISGVAEALGWIEQPKNPGNQVVRERLLGLQIWRS
jgi:hypothetical protein